MTVAIRPLRRDDVEGCLRVIASLPRFFGVERTGAHAAPSPRREAEDQQPAAVGAAVVGRRSIVGHARVREQPPRAAHRAEDSTPAPGGRNIAQAARDLVAQGGLVAAGPGDEVIAFLTWKRHNDTAAEITWMAVHSSLRHHGVGTRLLSRVEKLLAAQGFRHLSAITSASSHTYRPTRQFWQARGYAPLLELEDLWDTDTAVVMSKTL
jgi:GNAT superfamily N-acetyltransferase